LLSFRCFSMCLRSNDPPTTFFSTLSLHDALPISFAVAALLLHGLQQTVLPVPEIEGDLVFGQDRQGILGIGAGDIKIEHRAIARSEEHTSELQSRENLVCRLLLEKKK